MRHQILTVTLAFILLTGVGSDATAQCPTVSDISPTIIGRAINPATTYWNLNGDVTDGDTIVIDTTGANVAFEFDADSSVTGDNIPVVIPSTPADQETAREALIATVNAELSSPCTISSDFSYDLPGYLAVVWKGEDSGYGATNSKSGDNITVRSLSHYGNAYSYILLTGTDLNTVTGAKLVHTVTADELPAKNLRAGVQPPVQLFYQPGDGLELGFAVAVAADGINPVTEAPALGEYDIVLTSSCGTTTIPAGIEVVDNLINDPTFNMNMIGNTIYNGWYGGYNHKNVWPGPLWEHDNTPGTEIGTWDFREKANTYEPGNGNKREDPWDTLDSIWGSLTGDRLGRHEARQTIAVSFTQPTLVTITGMWAGGTSAEIEYGVELKDQSGAVIFQNGPNTEYNWIDATPPNDHWADFWATGEFPAGTTEIEVVFYLDIKNDYVGAALHFDDLLLFEGVWCPNQPTITSIGPGYGVRGTEEDITVTGTNFDDGDPTTTSVKLYRGATEVSPTSLSVTSATELTATFDLTGLDLDYWSISVENAGCPAAATLADAFNVVLAGPGLTNGSFELPAYLRDPPCQFGTYTDVEAEDWTSIHVHPYGGGGHYRDGNGKGPGDIPWDVYLYAPTCLPPAPVGEENLHWASVSGPYDSYAGMRRLTQTVTVTPGTYTLSGIFAAGGPNDLSISLLDGGYQDATIAEETVLASGDNDWTFGYVSGTVTGDLVTAVWDTGNTAEGWKVGHADRLALEECAAAVEVTSIDPTAAASGIVLTDATITGSGFTGTPTVYLVRPGFTVEGTNVVVDSDTSLACDFDMTGAGFGLLDVIVGNNGCYATLADAIFTAPGIILNPEFEDPTIWDGQDPPEPALPCLGAVEGEVDVWEVANPLSFRRDDTVLADALTCPNPNAAGGHYASLSTDQAESLQVYQVLKVTPGKKHLVGGWFAGGGNAAVTLSLVNGIDPGGSLIASETVMQTSGIEQTDWALGTVQGTPSEEFMTIIWEMTGTGGLAASHADGFYLDESICNVPFADTDADTDVDQDDFGVFQTCYTGVGGSIPQAPTYCSCLDVDGDGGIPDGDIDQADLSQFEDCASGPEVPASPTCD